MTYEESIHWLYNELATYQNIGQKALNPSLDKILQLCQYLGNPQDHFKSIHIAGTNGKGSTAHMMASVLQENGYKVGLHTSPHLLCFEERNRINGENMHRAFVVDFVTKHKSFIEKIKASFFEVNVAMGFTYFAKQKVDIAVIETGLGGRFDATNIIRPILSIITNISLDHTAVLGNNLSLIATEKAGIIKPDTPVVIGEYTPETQDVFDQVAKKKKAPIYYVNANDNPGFKTDLKGIYQEKNLRTVSLSLSLLNDLGIEINPSLIKTGLQKVQKNTSLHGRWEVLSKKPLVIADTAHNPNGIAMTMQQSISLKKDKMHFVLGFVNDKDLDNIVTHFPKNGCFYFCSPQIFRGMDIDTLATFIPKDLDSSYFNSVEKALNNALKNAKKNDLVYIGGSTFVVADALQILAKNKLVFIN